MIAKYSIQNANDSMQNSLCIYPFFMSLCYGVLSKEVLLLMSDDVKLYPMMAEKNKFFTFKNKILKLNY